MSGIATELNNVSVQPSESCQKEMAAMYRHSKEILRMLSCQLLSTQPKGDTLVANGVSPNHFRTPVVMMMMMMIMTMMMMIIIIII
jgi:hypothetical protein